MCERAKEQQRKRERERDRRVSEREREGQQWGPLWQFKLKVISLKCFNKFKYKWQTEGREREGGRQRLLQTAIGISIKQEREERRGRRGLPS